MGKLHDYGRFMRSIKNMFKYNTSKTAYWTTNNIFNLPASENQQLESQLAYSNLYATHAILHI